MFVNPKRSRPTVYSDVGVQPADVTQSYLTALTGSGSMTGASLPTGVPAVTADVGAAPSSGIPTVAIVAGLALAYFFVFRR